MLGASSKQRTAAGLASLSRCPARIGSRAMLTGLLCLLVLTGALLVLRVRADATAIPPRLEAHRYGQILPLAAVLLASYPLLRLASGVSAPPQPFWGDVTSHARVAAEMARTGL